ncbi:hypothetical protein F5890DRAFT_1478865 [Lentinula detonsa]|uniref:TPR-like protein n=1 Tax=Lentinula detonsa TaxID=2804962 RepID=A0AA38PPM3_9AGAR|nr:hypothetical protein F5890DRAFT_1478865 [Lentinula detonsa]
MSDHWAKSRIEEYSYGIWYLLAKLYSPMLIDGIDILSNILYVTNNWLKLTRLANEFLVVDKNRPEVCCLVGNHYSLRGDHVKAIKYFRRATQLDRTYLSAWTLMGHEYVEIKNSHAAIEAYRRAYATALKPYDVRLWQAQGMCYEETGRLREAVECLKRALVLAQITINLMLARIHRNLVRPVQDYAKSCLEVAAYQLKSLSGDLILTEEYLERVAASNAEDVARAVEMLKEVLSYRRGGESSNA